MWDIEGVASREAAEDQLSSRREQEKRREEKRRDDGTRCRTVKYHPRGTRAGPSLSNSSLSREINSRDLARDAGFSARAASGAGHGDGNVQSSGGSSNDTQREQREIARISRHQQQQRPTQATTIAATTTTATAAPTRAQWWSHQGSTGRERTASCGRDDSSGSTTYQYS